MKKKWWIILIIAFLAILGALFLVQHFFLRKYGCNKSCKYDDRGGICEYINYRYNCSFKTFITNDSISEKLFLRFGIDTRNLKEKQKESSYIEANLNDNREYIGVK